MPRYPLTDKERHVLRAYAGRGANAGTHLRSIIFRLRHLNLNQMRVDIELIQLALAKYEEAHE